MHLKRFAVQIEQVPATEAATSAEAVEKYLFFMANAVIRRRTHSHPGWNLLEKKWVAAVSVVMVRFAVLIADAWWLHRNLR